MTTKLSTNHFPSMEMLMGCLACHYKRYSLYKMMKQKLFVLWKNNSFRHFLFMRLTLRQHPVLSQVYSFCARGWPTTSHSLDKKLIPFFEERLQLTTRNGCLLWGLQVVIPSQYQKSILDLLHEGHPGMSRMKSLA